MFFNPKFNDMKLVFPNINYKDKAIEFVEEFHQYNSEINGSGSLERYLTNYSYEQWLLKLSKDLDIANIDYPKVPALTYFYVDTFSDKIIGMINIRIWNNDILEKEFGNVGYCVRPSERNKRYGTQMLEKSLEIYRKIGTDKIVMTCYKNNIASAKVIQNCNGVLDSEYFDNNHKFMQKYIIKI